MKRLGLTAALLIVLFAAALIAGNTVLADDPEDPAVLGLPDPVVPLPMLTDDEKSTAKALTKVDRRLRKLLGKVPYDIAEVGVWHTSDREKLGAVLRLQLGAPATVEGDWPVISYDQAEGDKNHPYVEEGLRASLADVREVFVLVDLHNHKIVSIEPGPDSMLISSNAQPRSTTPRGR